MSNMNGKMSIIAEKTSITAQKMSNTVPGVRHPPRFVRYPCEFPHIAECPPCPPNPFETGNLTVTPYLRIGHYGCAPPSIPRKNGAEHFPGQHPADAAPARKNQVWQHRTILTILRIPRIFSSAKAVQKQAARLFYAASPNVRVKLDFQSRIKTIGKEPLCGWTSSFMTSSVPEASSYG